ncbi:MAG: hypothetical protein U0939_14870 [Pirellulales bacterium]
MNRPVEPLDILVIGSLETFEWIREFSGLRFSSLQHFLIEPRRHSNVQKRLRKVSSRIEAFYSVSFLDRMRAVTGVNADRVYEQALSKLVVFDDASWLYWGPKVARQIAGYGRTRRFFPTLTILPVSYVLVTTRDDLGDLQLQLLEDGFAFLVNPTMDRRGVFQDRIEARRQAVLKETDFHRSRVVRNLLVGAFASLIVVPFVGPIVAGTIVEYVKVHYISSAKVDAGNSTKPDRTPPAAQTDAPLSTSRPEDVPPALEGSR